MNSAVSSFTKLILLILAVFSIFGWLIRDRSQLAADLRSLQAQHAEQKTEHQRVIQTYQARIAELESRLADAEQAKAQYDPLLAAYTSLQNQTMLDAETIEQLRQLLAAEQTARAQAEAAHEALRQNAAHDVQMCRNQLHELQALQAALELAPAEAPPHPWLQEADERLGLVVFIVTLGALGLGAVGVAIDRSRAARRRRPTDDDRWPGAG